MKERETNEKMFNQIERMLRDTMLDLIKFVDSHGSSSYQDSGYYVGNRWDVPDFKIVGTKVPMRVVASTSWANKNVSTLVLLVGGANIGTVDFTATMTRNGDDGEGNERYKITIVNEAEVDKLADEDQRKRVSAQLKKYVKAYKKSKDLIDDIMAHISIA